MTNIEIAQKQLEQFYSAIAHEKQRIVEIRKWAITVWLAIMIGLASNKIVINKFFEPIIVFFPIIAFWLLEGFQHMWVKIDNRKAKQVEQFIVSYSSGSEFPIEYFYASSYGTFTYSQKLMMLFGSLFFTERVVIFYLLLIILSFIYLVRF